MISAAASAFLAAMLIAPSAWAIVLDWPVRCQPGRTCFVQNHVDHEPGPGFADYRCGPLGYDKHSGTDIRLPGLTEMRRGVPVLAAAPGRVLRVRDGEEDRSVRVLGIESVRGKECGNGLVIQHADGWQSQYCHMRKGSIGVKPGQIVTAGHALGEVGLSGDTEFPHLHFQLTHAGQIIDPFDARALEAPCGTKRGKPLWRKAPAYQASGLLYAGFTGQQPTDDAALDPPRTPPIATSPLLVYEALVYGVRDGDELRLSLRGPDGALIAEKNDRFGADRAQYFRFIGLKNKKPLKGSYTGHVRLTRMGKPVIDTVTITTIE